MSGLDEADRLLMEYEKLTGYKVGEGGPGVRVGQPLVSFKGHSGRPEWDRAKQAGQDRAPEKVPPLGRYGLMVGLGTGRHAVLVEIHEPTFGEWDTGTVMASVYSGQGFEDSYGRVHKQRAFAVISSKGYFVFKRTREMIAHGGDGPEAKPLREATDAVRSMVTEGKWVEYAIQFGKATGICGVCHRRLDKPESIAAGIGPVCARRYR